MKKYGQYLCILWISLFFSACEPLAQPPNTVEEGIATITSPTRSPEPLPTANNQAGLLEKLTPDNISQIELIDQWGKGRILDVDMTPDGRSIAVATTTGIYLYDGSTLEETLFWAKHEPDGYYMNAVAFSPDGRYLAVGIKDISIWNISENTIEKVVENILSGALIDSIEYSSDGKRLLTMGKADFLPKCDGMGGNFQLYEIETGKLLYYRNYCPEASINYMSRSIKGMAFFTGRNPESTTYDYETTMVNIDTGKVENLYISNFSELVYDINSDGTLMAQKIYKDGKIFTDIIKVNSGNVIESFPGYRLFNSTTNKTFIRNITNESTGWELRDSSDQFICSFSEGNQQLYMSPEPYRSDFRRRGAYLFTWNYWQQEIQIWDTTNCTLVHVLPFYFSNYNPKFTADGSIIAGASSHYVHLWDTATGIVKQSIKGISLNHTFMINSENNILIYTIEEEEQSVMNFVDIQTGELTDQIVNDKYADLVISPNNRILVTMNYDGLSFWNLTNNQVNYDSGFYSNISFLENGFNPESSKFAFLNEQDKKTILTILNVQTGETIVNMTIPSERNPVLSPDWQTLATTDSDGYIQVWNLNNLRLEHTFLGYHISGEKKYYIDQLFYSPDSKILVSRKGNLVRFWDVEGETLAGEISAEYGLQNLAFSPDQYRIAAFAMDGTVKIFGVRRDDLRE